MRLTRAAQCGYKDETDALDAVLEPLWALFSVHGSLRIMYAIADQLSLSVGDPPLPLKRVGSDVAAAIEATLNRLGV